jgi:hypothetical protein
MDAYHKSPFPHKLVETIHNIFGDDMNVTCCDINYDAMSADGIGKRFLKPRKTRLKNVGYDLRMKQKVTNCNERKDFYFRQKKVCIVLLQASFSQ